MEFVLVGLALIGGLVVLIVLALAVWLTLAGDTTAEMLDEPETLNTRGPD